jgi:arylsulfatase A-like enzyme
MSQTQPNIIVITTDQQRCDSLSCYGSTFTSTPHIDRLAAEGALLQRAYCANPVCTPARASIFSGQYLSRHEAWNVGMNVPEDTPLLSHRLATLGYRTHYVGKAHFQAFGGGARSRESYENWEEVFARWQGPYYGFETVELSLGHTVGGMRGHYGLWLNTLTTDEERAEYAQVTRVGEGDRFGGEAYEWSLPSNRHSSTWTAEKSIQFLESHNPSQPFFLAIGFQDPHHAHCVPIDFADRVDSDQVPLPRYQAGELADKPPHFEIAHQGKLEDSPHRGAFPVAGQGAGADFGKISETEARNGRAYYYTMVKLIDQQMGRILDCLKERGLAENTLIVFTSDHGELLGDHGLWMKGPFHYEELIRIPLIVRWPTGIRAGQSIQSLCSHVDLAPTILAAIGASIADEIEGLNALPLLQAEKETIRDHVITECVDDPNHLRLKTITTQNRKLTYYHGEDFGELYDLTTDPGEICNRWDDPEYRQDRNQLTARIVDHLERLERRAERYSYA